MLKIPFAACPCPSQLILAQFALEMCLAARYRQKTIKGIKGIKGYPRSLISMPIKSQYTTFY